MYSNHWPVHLSSADTAEQAYTAVFQPPKGVESMCIVEDLTKLTASDPSGLGHYAACCSVAYLGLHVQEW